MKRSLQRLVSAFWLMRDARRIRKSMASVSLKDDYRRAFAALREQELEMQARQGNTAAAFDVDFIARLLFPGKSRPQLFQSGAYRPQP